MNWFACFVVLSAVLFCSTCYSAVQPLGSPAMGIRIDAGTYIVKGSAVEVKNTAGIMIDKPECVKVRGEEQSINEEQARSYIGGIQLKKTYGPVDTFTRLPNTINPASVKISALDGSIRYEEGKDYTLDYIWGGVSRVDGGRIPKSGTILVDYDVFLQRVDAVQVSTTGEVSIKKGVSSQIYPQTPDADPDCTVIAYVFVPYRTTEITQENIYPCPAKDITWRNYIRVTGTDRVKRSRKLLKEGKPISIVCWGDSVTAGGSSSSHEKSYVEVFRSQLKAAYPKSDINLINAGIGGSSTDSRKAGFDKEVLSYKPDLITVEFVNDMGMPADHIAANYKEFIERARKVNPEVEFIIIIPHYVMSEWMTNFKIASDAMKKAAKDNGAAVSDTAHIWANLGEVCIPYTTLLANGINHPNDLGHEFFAASLMELLK